MFGLIWAALLFSVRGSSADTGASVGLRPFCFRGQCITLSEGEITAVAGLCVVIPCLFTTGYGFIPQHIVWYKCEPSKPKCGDSDIIFNTYKNSKVQSGFKGRVSLLEPDMNHGNCSIIINDLTESDSGSYQLRVNGLLNGREVGYTFSSRARVSVKGLTQRPTVMIPPLTEGQQTTLTCTAPGLCSGSVPEITWMWRGAGGKVSHITGNITAFKTEDLTAFTQRHSSTLTFNPLGTQHHGTDVTCKVSFANNIATEETVTLNVTLYPMILISSKCELQSEVLTCVCISEGFPLPTIRWPLLKNQAEYSVTTTVSNHTVNSTLTLTVKDHSNTAVECVSSSEVGKAKANLIIVTSERREDEHGPCAVLLWTVVAVVSLIVNVLCIILWMFLWITRKKVKPNQEDRTYMSLQKTGPSPEYDVIV
ncbi:sialic acid-binding Ig-like lectin 10 isoform X2 [Epinephelus fuscoguttatus]|uniref:sialic acid-binding Ig-like lectin 10 isoform X2 n=1 Tax=Epinephelus fuscoguttatus TaxID=293821 RepID=UPI0020D130E2|nr:sialic acid-binding Ig-like lectin 10 isoform X2 [Epinephelus fuscoguttatus]